MKNEQLMEMKSLTSWEIYELLQNNNPEVEKQEWVTLTQLKEWLSQFIRSYPGGYERSYDSTKRFAINKFIKERLYDLNKITTLYPKGEEQKQ